ncbi:MAG TPA: proton-conducting transporter membrane subunit [Candidatus Dormibacteraeota bacterium]|nr:proton-conducting transporter membrane subunit [Candidatus Dormibacteraeota bacterium]
MSHLQAWIIAIPGALAVLSLLLPSRIGRPLTAVGGLATGILIVVLALATAKGQSGLDALSALFLLPVGIVYGTVGLYTSWYVEVQGVKEAPSARYRRRFLALTNAFACAEALVPVLTNMAGLWVAVEATTVIAALLVRLEGTDAALEAAWKYILIASCGLAIGLVGVLLLYASATTVLGFHHVPEWQAYLAAAKRLDPDAVRLAFVFALIGFGTKMGLAPMHTWLPDAHGAGPTPTSAMLSGILLSDALYVILRFTAITTAAVGSHFVHTFFFIVGLLSLALAAFVLLQQRDLKRMLAYSSIEHMGVVASGLGFGAPLAVAGALLHAITHASAKSLAFQAAGRIAHRYDTREIAGIRGAMSALPYSGTLFALAGLALAGAPPFGPFRSELMVLAGGFSSPSWGLAFAVLGLLVIAFAGLLRWVTQMCGGERPASVAGGEDSPVAVTALVLGFLVVLGLGLIVPQPLAVLIERSAAIVGVAP